MTLDTFTSHKFEDRNIVETRKKVRLSFPDVPIWPGLADVGPDTEFVGNPVTIRTTDGRSYSARVDIPRGDPALPLTDDELLDQVPGLCAQPVAPRRHRAQRRPGSGARDGARIIGTLMTILSSPLREA